MMCTLLVVLSGTSTAPPRPNIVMILADDLGFYDTQIYNPKSPTPTLANLTARGLRLDYHYTFRYCSPTRRSFLSGRMPNRITTVQPEVCSDFLPLNFTILSEKLASVGYENHFVGKAHLGFETIDHLPIHRGFRSHVGYLNGSEDYYDGKSNDGGHDMWENDAPAFDVVLSMLDGYQYSANFYTSRAVEIIQEAAASQRSGSSPDPLFMYFAIQNVHAPYELPLAWETQSFPDMWDHTYANMISMLDSAVANLTKALEDNGLWDNTLIVFSADNGGIGLGNNYPLRGHKHDPWEGGIRSAAFVSGGFLPEQLRGTTTGPKLVHISDWYTTFCNLAGVDASDGVVIDGVVHDIDGVDVWPMLTGENITQPRPITPVTESSIIDASSRANWWKLVTLAGQSNYYYKNQTQIPGTSPCLAGAQEDPPQPGRTDGLVNGGCPVCNSTYPCLYDLLHDPYETTNVAAKYKDLVRRLTLSLNESLGAYVTGHMDPTFKKNHYSKIDKRKWKDFAGPCYERSNKTSPKLTVPS